MNCYDTPCIPDFIVPDTWPPNSPDLNPVDHASWSVIQQRVYKTRVHDIDELRQRLLYEWCSAAQSLIDDAVDRWTTCLRACVRARGEHFEHTLWLSICFFLYLMNFTFHTMLDAADDVLRVHYKSMKCDVSFSQVVLNAWCIVPQIELVMVYRHRWGLDK